MTLYILQNDRDMFLTRNLEWVYGCDAAQLFHSPHKDIALNQLIELNARDIDLRARVVACDADKKGHPSLPLAADDSAA